MNLFQTSLLCFFSLLCFEQVGVASPLSSAQLEQFYHFINSGDYHQASETLERLENSPVKLVLGADLAYYQGRYSQAISFYEQVRKSINSPKILLNWSKALYQRGIFYKKLNFADKNLELRQLSEKDLRTAEIKVIALLQEFPQYLEARLLQAQLTRNVPPLLEADILSLNNSPQKCRFLLQLADITPKVSLWSIAFSIASQLEDWQYKSLAQGHLGEYYWRENNPKAALKAAWEAQIAATKINDWPSLIRWHYLAARAFGQLQQTEESITQYQLAVVNIRKLRQDLSGSPISPHLYFDVVAPVLNDYLRLLLLLPAPPLDEVIALQQLDQLAQLDNYFQIVCHFEEPTSTTLEEGVARIFFLELSDSTHAIVQLPHKSLHYSLKVKPENLRSLVNNWRLQLANTDWEESYELGQTLYQEILAPFVSELETHQIKHLQFISNGILRTVPLGAFHDGQQYLLEKFSISYSLGLSSGLPSSIQDEAVTPLIAGLTRSTSNFPNPLYYTENETKGIQQILGGVVLLNEAFSAQTLAHQLQQSQYDVLHLATHASFSFVREKAFLETGTGSISLTEFEAILKRRRSPIQLLTLSACQTALGNRYSALGLLGVGLRNGINTVVGSFWEVPDQRTSVNMQQLYGLWRNGTSLPEALRQIQIQQIRNGDLPADWASFIIAYH